MINNNYVPEWHISPFEHSKYTLVRNQDQFDLLFDDVTNTQEFLHIWQRIKKLMGEKKPSTEFEAYSIQRIAQDLFSMFQESETNGMGST